MEIRIVRSIKPLAARCAALAVSSLFSSVVALADCGSLDACPTIVITATRTPGAAVNPAQDVSVIDRNQITNMASDAVADALAQEAGVGVATSGGPMSTTGVFIRGTKPAQSMTLIDGFHLVNPTDGTAPIEQVPLGMLERVEVVRGPASGLYGSGAMGGVVQLFTREPDRAPAADAMVGTGSYGAYRSEAGYGGREGQTSYYVGVGADGERGFSAIKPGSPYYEPDNDGYRRHSLAGKWRGEFAGGSALRLTLLDMSARTDFDNGNPAPPYPYIESHTQLLGATLETRVNELWRADLKAGTVSYRYDNHNAGFVYAPRLRNDQFGWLNYLALPAGRFTVGLEQEVQTVRGDGVSYPKNQRVVDSAFVQWLGDYGRNHVQANIRADRWTDYGVQDTGDLLYAYSIAKGWDLTGAAGAAFRAPTFDDLYYPYFSNPNLHPEHGRNLEVGVRYKVAGDELRLVAFRNRIRDAIELDANWIPQNIETRIVGETASWRHADAGWRWNASWTHQNPENLSAGTQLQRRARNLVAGSLERRTGAWTLGAAANGQDQRYDNVSNNAASRMGGYGVLAAYASYAIAREWSAQLRVDNLTDKQYELSQGFNTPGRSVFVSLRYGAD
jgi:vitamin B12 transporter